MSETKVPENEVRIEAIRERAYQLFQERGATPGSELDDWVRAEDEVLRGVFASVDQILLAEPGEGPGVPALQELGGVNPAAETPP